MSFNAPDLIDNQPGQIEAAVPEISNPVTPLDQLLDKPALIDCPFCHQRALTKVIKNDSEATRAASCYCCLCIGLLGVWIPHVFHWYPDIDHLCTQCGQLVMRKPHAGPMEVKGPVLDPALKSPAQRDGMQYGTVDGIGDRKGPLLGEGVGRGWSGSGSGG